MNSSNEATYILTQIAYYSGSVGTPISLCVGAVGNALALIVLIRMRNGSPVQFLIALSTSDFGVMIGWSTFWLQGFFKPILIDAYDWACRLVLFEFYMSIHYSVWVLVAMTMERFVVVWFPLHAKTICKKRNNIILIIVVFLCILGLNMHNLFTRQVMDMGNGTTACLSSNIATPEMPYGDFHAYIWPWIDATVYAFVPVITLFALNVLIIYKIKSAESMAGKNTKEGASQSDQVTRTLLIVSFAFLILTSPIGAILIAEKNWNFQDDPLQYALWSALRAIAGLMECMNHSINFFLYCLGGKRFRQEVLKMLCPKRIAEHQASHTSQTNVSQISSSVQANEKV